MTDKTTWPVEFIANGETQIMADLTEDQIHDITNRIKAHNNIGGDVKMAKTLYTMGAVNEAIDTLVDLGYEIVIIPGVLLDSYICIAPNSNMYHYEFREVAMNSQSSAYTARRSSKLSKRVLDDLKAVGYEPPTLAQTIGKALLPRL